MKMRLHFHGNPARPAHNGKILLGFTLFTTTYEPLVIHRNFLLGFTLFTPTYLLAAAVI